MSKKFIKDKDYAEALENGISKATLRTRVYKLCWGIKRAKTEPIHLENRRKGKDV